MLKRGLILDTVLFTMLGTILFTAVAWSQTAPAPPSAAAPRVLLLVYQQFLPGKASARQSLEIDLARNFDRLAVPISWIELESLTGPLQALFVDPANSFVEIEKAGSVLAQVYGAQPDLAQSQQRIDEVVANSRTVTAVLRDDLSLNAATLNLAKARYLRIRAAQVQPEHEREFVSALTNNRMRGQAQTRTWAAYQVNAGLPEITFLFLEPMRSMQDVDQGLSAAALELMPFGVATSSETNLYAIHPEMSHVSKEFAVGEPGFWVQTPAP